MNLKDLLRLHPKLHTIGNGEPYSWQVSDDILSVIDKNVSEKSNTLEIGAGVSTVLFALKEANHTCIVPFEQEVLRIKSFCREHNIPIERLKFEIDYSERVLPKLELDGLDLVLIDGAHGFPMPLIDWYYSCPKLKVGGILILDDTHIWPGHILKEFLMAESEWKIEVDFNPRCVVFKRVKEGGFGKNESAQPYIVRQTLDFLYPDYVEVLSNCFAPHSLPELLREKQRSAEEKMRRLLARNGFRESNNLRMNIDNIEIDKSKIFVRGWAFIDDGKPANNSEIFLIIRDADNTHILGTSKTIRTDVTHCIGNNVNYDNSGFSAHVNISIKAPYKIGIGVIRTDEIAFQFVKLERSENVN